MEHEKRGIFTIDNYNIDTCLDGRGLSNNKRSVEKCFTIKKEISQI